MVNRIKFWFRTRLVGLRLNEVRGVLSFDYHIYIYAAEQQQDNNFKIFDDVAGMVEQGKGKRGN